MHEVLTHPYQNRTGDLERSTKAELVIDSPNYVQVDLVMGMYYAGYVVDLGYSNIDEAAAIAEDAVELVMAEHFFPEFF